MHLKVNKRELCMMQELNCGLIKLPTYNVGLPYGYVRIMTQAAQYMQFKIHSLAIYDLKALMKNLSFHAALLLSGRNGTL